MSPIDLADITNGTAATATEGRQLPPLVSPAWQAPGMAFVVYTYREDPLAFDDRDTYAFVDGGVLRVRENPTKSGKGTGETIYYFSPNNWREVVALSPTHAQNHCWHDGVGFKEFVDPA